MPVGEVVWLPKWRVRGVVLKWPEAGDLVEVQAGQITLKVQASQLEPLSTREPPPPAPRSQLPYVRRHSVQEISHELNIIGWRVPDALSHLDKYLDEAVAAGLQRVRIIHGKGKGILREQMKRFLSGNQLVRDFRLGEMGEGGTGVTIVTLES